MTGLSIADSLVNNLLSYFEAYFEEKRFRRNGDAGARQRPSF